jgi:FAD/FMN-containing dehydrogenase
VLGEQRGDQLTAAGDADLVEDRDTGRAYATFARGPADPRDLFPPDAYRRLQRVKAEVDPDDLFLAIHPIPAGRLSRRV